MKNIFLGLLAFAMMSSTAYATGGRKKAKKVKAVCTQVCADKKDCKIMPNCTPMPGCCKM